MHKKIVALSILAASASFAASVTVAGNAFTHTFGTGDQIYIAPFSATVEADPAAAYVPVELGVGAEAVTTFNGVFQVVNIPITVNGNPVTWHPRLYYTSAGSTFKFGIGNGLNGAYPIDAPVQSSNLPLGHIDPIPTTILVPLANVPEPATWLLIGSALCAIPLLRKR